MGVDVFEKITTKLNRHKNIISIIYSTALIVFQIDVYYLNSIFQKTSESIVLTFILVVINLMLGVWCLEKSSLRNDKLGETSTGILQSEDGFSLAEMSIAIGLVGLLSVGVMTVTKNQSKSSNKALGKAEEIRLISQIKMILADKRNCEATVLGEGLNAALNSIKNKRDMELFKVGSLYGNRDVEITSLNLGNPNISPTSKTGTIDLQVVTNLKKINGESTNNQILLQVEVDATNRIVSCYSQGTEGIGAVDSEKCNMLGGSYNEVSESCVYSDPCLLGEGHIASSVKCGLDTNNKIVKLSGSVMSGNINVTKINKNEVCIGSSCRTTFSTQKCLNDQYVVTIKSNGTIVCSQSLKCPSGKYLEGFNTSTGEVICKTIPTETCPQGEYISKIKNDGSIECTKVPVVKDMSCPKGEFIKKISSGVVTCAPYKAQECSGENSRTMYLKNIVTPPEVCLSETQNRSCNSGSWSSWSGTYSQATCSCSANCKKPEEVCNGLVDTSSDGCGGTCNIIGTKKNCYEYHYSCTSGLGGPKLTGMTESKTCTAYYETNTSNNCSLPPSCKSGCTQTMYTSFGYCGSGRAYWRRNCSCTNTLVQ